MSKQQNADEIVRQANAEFEFDQEYSDPFASLKKKGEKSSTFDLSDLRKQIEAPVQSQSKPEAESDDSDSESEVEEDDKDASAAGPVDKKKDDEDSDSSEDEDEDPKGATTPPGERPEHSSAQSDGVSPKGRSPPKPSNAPSPEKPKLAEALGSPKRSPPGPQGVQPKDSGLPDSGERAPPGGLEKQGTNRRHSSRGSTSGSPFRHVTKQSSSFVLSPGSNAASVRTGGVTSPPPSDTASIAGKREDQEDPLEHVLGDSENLIDDLLSSAKRMGPVQRKSAPLIPQQAKGKGRRSMSALGGQNDVETVLANSFEIRITALESLTEALIKQNQLLRNDNNILVDKTDLLITELTAAKSQLETIESRMIIEINEKLKRVGGPSPQVTVTAPSPVTAAPSVGLPGNVVPSGSSSLQPASPVANTMGLTGAALARWRARTGN